MEAEERVISALKFEIESANIGRSTARSTLAKALLRLAREQEVKLTESAATAVAQLAVLTFLKETIENEKSLAHIQLEADYKTLESEYQKLRSECSRYNDTIFEYKKACMDIALTERKLEKLKSKCTEYEELQRLKSTDARLYGARCAYEFAYQKTRDEKIALKSFNSYLIGNSESKEPVEEFSVCDMDKEEEKLERF